MTEKVKQDWREGKWYNSTLCITRSKAKELFLEHTYGDISDNILELFMDVLLEPQLNNCRIVPDDCAENDDELI